MNFPELTRKAEAGSCAAQTTLGLYYLHGYGPVEVDYEKAFDLLSKATEKGASRAVANLADMYAQGLGVAQDIPKAIELYERVGTIEFFAALELGRIYAKGLGVPANPRKAFEWYSAVVAFEREHFNCEGLSEELNEAKEYIRRVQSDKQEGKDR